MSYAYKGRILRVDLGREKISYEEPDELFYRRYFGGTALVAYYLLKEVPLNTDPLGPENKLIFATGVLTGIPLAGSGRNSVGALSPLTGKFGDAQAGGYWGVELKRAGLDAIIVEGCAKEPVYLWINDGEVEIRRAGHLWGTLTGECERKLKAELGDERIRVSQIGPAGENLVHYACIANDRVHFAGRCGIGAVMGSKKLKAIVVRGTGSIAVKDKEKIREEGRWFGKNWKDRQWGWHENGTAGIVESLHISSGLPTRNFNEGQFEGFENLKGETMRETIMVDRETCFACAVRCKRVVESDGKYKIDRVYGGPEYETIAALGSCCGVDDLEAVCKANELCAAYTLDTISTGVTIAFAMECYENGLLSREDTGGLELKFGNAEAMVKMVEMIAQRKGLGELLAKGSYRAAREIGGEAMKYVMAVKGQELPMHEPRFKQGLGIGYMISPTGADHNHNVHDSAFSQEGGGLEGIKPLGFLEPIPVDDLGPKKIKLLKLQSTWSHFMNCAVLCIFPSWTRLHLEEMVRAATGWNVSLAELLQVGERAVNMARMYNLALGLKVEDDVLPERFSQGFSSGPLKGVGISKEDSEKARHMYYEAMGWERDTGRPTDYKLNELDIEWINDVLE